MSEELIRQLPSLGVLVWLVHQFLTHLRAEGEANRGVRKNEIETQRAFTKTLDELREEIRKRPLDDIRDELRRRG